MTGVILSSSAVAVAATTIHDVHTSQVVKPPPRVPAKPASTAKNVICNHAYMRQNGIFSMVTPYITVFKTSSARQVTLCVAPLENPLSILEKMVAYAI